LIGRPPTVPCEVDQRELAELGRPVLDGRQLACSGAQPLELLLDEPVRHHRLRADRLEAEVGGQLGGRGHGDRGREAERLAVAGQGVVVDLGAVDGLNAGGVQRPAVPGGQVLPDRLGHHGLLAHPRAHDVRRHLALAEARDAEVLREVAHGVRDRVADVLGGHLDGEAHAIFGEGLDCGLHVLGSTEGRRAANPESLAGMRGEPPATAVRGCGRLSRSCRRRPGPGRRRRARSGS
jgi:hypothetical protein